MQTSVHSNMANGTIKKFDAPHFPVTLRTETSLSDLYANLITEYGASYVVFANCTSLTDGNANGFYLLWRNSNQSTEPRKVYINTFDVVDLGNTQSLAKAAIPKSAGNITDANNTSLYGRFFKKDTECSNLPTSSGKYYEVFATGMAQYATEYGNNGVASVWTRQYANNKWYTWRRVDKPDLEYGTVTQTIAAFQTPVCKKSGNIVDFVYEINPSSSQITLNTANTVCTLPDGFRPANRRIFIVPVDNGSGGLSGQAIANIGTNGVVTVSPTIVGFMAITASFIVAS